MTHTCDHPTPGFRFRGLTKNSLWGQWVPDTSSGTSQPQRVQEQRQIREQRRQQEQHQPAVELTAEQRDRYYRQLLSQLCLNPADRADLIKRGFTPEQIERFGPKSVNRRQPVMELPHDLPGVDLDGRHLSISQPGYLYPIRNVDGLLVGCQLRLKEGCLGGRYRWLSSVTRKRPYGPGPKLPNRELPLAVYQPASAQSGVVALVEGTGPKPFLASERLQQVVIGAAGGLWPSSPKTLQYSLKQLGAQTLILYPDAGAIANKNVMGQYRRTYELLQSWGYPLQVAWWGQTAKGCDIDELDAPSLIQKLSWDEFIALAPSYLEQSVVVPMGSQSNPLPDSWSDQAALKRAAELDQLEAAEVQGNRELAEQQQVCQTLSKLFGKKRQQVARAKRGFAPSAPMSSVSGSALVRLKDLPSPALLVHPETVPTHENWQRQGCPELLFKSSDREAIWDRLIACGYPYVLDEGGAGDGKSRAAGRYLQAWTKCETAAQQELASYSGLDTDAFAVSEEGSPDEIQENRAFYFSSSYRTPSTLELENLPGAETGGGLVYTGEALPSGSPAVRRAKLGEKPNVEPNCPEDDNVQRLRALGIHSYRGKRSPFCQNCRHLEGCSFLQALEQQRSFPVLRSHPSLGGSGIVAFVDEATRALQTEQDIAVTEDVLEGELGRLSLDSQVRHFGIADLAGVIVKGLKDAIQERGFWGSTHNQILRFLPPRWELQQTLTEIEDRLRRDAISPALTDPSIDIWDLPEAKVDREFRRVAGHDLDTLFDGILDPEVKAKLIKSQVQPGAIRYVLQAICDGYGTLEITSNGGLKVQRPSSLQAKTLKRFRTVIGLDATPDRLTWAMQLQIRLADICIIKPVDVADYSNLTVQIIDGLGSCGRQREDGGEYALQSRLQQLVSTLVQRSPDSSRVGILDSKLHLSNYSSLVNTQGVVLGYNWHDNQGTNKFKGCTTLIAVNPKPLPNLTAAATTWNTRTGGSISSAAQQRWLQRQGQHHLLQLIGRARAQHTTDAIIVNLVASNITHADVLAILAQYPGCQIQRVNVLDICPKAAPRVVQVRRRLIETIVQRIQRGQSTSRSAVANELECSGPNLAQIAKPVGGWKGLVSLLERIYRGTYPLGELTPDLEVQLQWIGEVLPQLVEQFLSGFISLAAAITGAVDLVEMAADWSLWLPDRAFDALHTLLVAAAPDWAMPVFLALSPPELSG